MVSLQTILQDHSDFFELPCDPKENESSDIDSKILFKNVSTPENPKPETIIFLSKSSHLEQIQTHQKMLWQKTLWIISKDFWEKAKAKLLEESAQQSNFILICRNLQMSMALVLPYFDRRDELYAFPKGISPNSWIHPSAEIEPGVNIGPFTSIGPNTIIKQGSHIGPHCTIEGEVQIGAQCFLEGNIFIGRQTKIGNHCRIKPFASLGTDGYGYIPGKNETVKIPQIGKLIIEDFVDIGSGTCIDRATITQTKIGQGTKIDNLVHIAHNCEIGRYCFITACFAIAGSSKIGDHFMTGGTSSVADHVTIANNVVLAGASVVMSDIPEPGQYGGHPLQPMKSYLKTQVTLTQLLDFKKQINFILKHLNLNKQE